MSQSIDQHTWDAFVLLNGPRSGAFLQSWAWGEFQKAAHHHIDRHVYEDRNGLVGIAQLSRRLIPVVGFYDYIARGPIVSDVSRLEEVMDGLSGVSAFVRFDATVDPTISLPKSRVEKTIDGQPARTVMNDLRLSEHALLEGMHAKTRYNIGLAEKKDLEIRVEGVTIEDVWHLFEETSNRGDFRLHEREYYETMLVASLRFSPLLRGS